MRVIGQRRGETYPTPNFSAAAGAMPFVQLGISAPFDYVAGPPVLIPFDTIVYESAAFGAFGAVAGIGTVWRVPFGAYLAVLQTTDENEEKPFSASVAITSLTGSDSGVNATEAVTSGVTVSISAMRFASETPLAGAGQPCAVVPFLIPLLVGDPGTLQVSTTKLFVWLLQRF